MNNTNPIETLKIKEEINNMFKDLPNILNVKQTSEVLGIGRNLTYKLLKENKIICKKVGNLYKIPKICIVHYLNSQI